MSRDFKNFPESLGAPVVCLTLESVMSKTCVWVLPAHLWLSPAGVLRDNITQSSANIKSNQTTIEFQFLIFCFTETSDRFPVSPSQCLWFHRTYVKNMGIKIIKFKHQVKSCTSANIYRPLLSKKYDILLSTGSGQKGFLTICACMKEEYQKVVAFSVLSTLLIHKLICHCKYLFLSKIFGGH